MGVGLIGSLNKMAIPLRLAASTWTPGSARLHPPALPGPLADGSCALGLLCLGQPRYTLSLGPDTSRKSDPSWTQYLPPA